MARSSVRLTYDDYLHFPADRRWEVIEGEAFVVPSPNRRHQHAVLELASRIRQHLRVHGGGHVLVAPFDVVLFDTDVVQPDVVFVSDADVGVLTDANVRGAPTWVVEVLSDPRRDRRLEKQAYERAGVGEYWIVDPETASTEVYRLRARRYGPPTIHGAGETVSPACLPGLRIDPAELISA